MSVEADIVAIAEVADGVRVRMAGTVHPTSAVELLTAPIRKRRTSMAWLVIIAVLGLAWLLLTP